MWLQGPRPSETDKQSRSRNSGPRGHPACLSAISTQQAHPAAGLPGALGCSFLASGCCRCSRPLYHLVAGQRDTCAVSGREAPSKCFLKGKSRVWGWPQGFPQASRLGCGLLIPGYRKGRGPSGEDVGTPRSQLQKCLVGTKPASFEPLC